MLDQPPPPRRGKDFLIGFIPSQLLAFVMLAMVFIFGRTTPLIMFGYVLLIASIVAFIRRRPFIGIGIFSVIVATPVLLIGSCFAFVSI